jgi:hypothetical protein
MEVKVKMSPSYRWYTRIHFYWNFNTKLDKSKIQEFGGKWDELLKLNKKKFNENSTWIEIWDKLLKRNVIQDVDLNFQ